jgi:hypothetical protein
MRFIGFYWLMSEKLSFPKVVSFQKEFIYFSAKPKFEAGG